MFGWLTRLCKALMGTVTVYPLPSGKMTFFGGTVPLRAEYSKRVGRTCPGPYVNIVLRFKGRETPPITAIVDSGAAITCVPRQYLDILRPVSVAKPVIVGCSFLGGVKRVKPFYAEVLLQEDGEHWRGVRPDRGVIFSEGTEAFLGRDVLDAFIVILDGETATLIPKEEK